MDIKTKIGKAKNSLIMNFNSQNLFKPLETFLMNDQPFTCLYCGSRCVDIASFYHTNAKALVELCLNTQCGFICYEEEDEYFLRLWKIN